MFQDVVRAPGEKLLICNVPPFPVERVYATFIVDFKMMKAIFEGAVNLDDYSWILGRRPQSYMELNPQFLVQHAKRVKAYYTHVPDYAVLTYMNAGLTAAHYACSKLGCTELDLYGFDSIFDMELYSHTDRYVPADRSEYTLHMIVPLWRQIWKDLFAEFPEVQFTLHHLHDCIKINLPENAAVREPQ